MPDRYLQRIPWYGRLARLPCQLSGTNPFDGDSKPSRIKLFDPGSGRPTLPFPHPWNYSRPIQILETFFWNADQERGPQRDNRYLDVPGFAPVLVTRDPGIIRTILKLFIPKDTHILLDVWHANRREEAWGIDATGYPACEFAPDRWDSVGARSPASRSPLHFGFGDGARVCPGKFLGQLEVGLVVGAVVRTFSFRAVNREVQVRAGVSTKPLDGALVDLELR